MNYMNSYFIIIWGSSLNLWSFVWSGPRCTTDVLARFSENPTERQVWLSEDTIDCALYYTCHYNRVVASHRCPGRHIWSTKQQRCIHPILADDRPSCACFNGYSRKCEACYGNRGTSYRQDPYQCGRYYLCEGFNAIQTKFCPSHQTWSDRRQRCVLNTAWPDSCILRPDRVTIPSVTTSTPSFRGSTQHRKSWPPLTQAPHIEGDRKEERWRGTQSPSNSSSEYDWLECNAVVTSPYIVGGLPASDGQWPWQVLLKGKLNSTHTTQCGGVLIGTKWIVTAAHCVYRPSLQHAAAWTVTLGEHTINTSSGREKVITPSNIIRHEDYSPTGGFANDIALIELPQHLDLNPRSVFPICIASSAGHLHIDPDRCWITGWGNTEGTGDSNVLQTLKVHMWSQHRCKAIWTGLTGDGHICITSENSGACLGDSGGPLSCKVNDKFVLAGIASWGVTTCRNSHFPDVYTNVSFYTDWIRRHVTSHNN